MSIIKYFLILIFFSILHNQAIAEEVKKIGKFKIRLIKYDFTDTKYTSMFIKVKKSEKLSLVRKKFSKTNYLKQYSKYQPHISLYYGETDTKLKKKLFLNYLN